ncbi:UNVERIFIED_CONTAM: hypothetical protein NCL1_38239 [Trichonephila clavipes]
MISDCRCLDAKYFQTNLCYQRIAFENLCEHFYGNHSLCKPPNISLYSQQSKENFKKARFCCESYFVYTVMLTVQLIRPLIMFPGRGENDPQSEDGKVDQ